MPLRDMMPWSGRKQGRRSAPFEIMRGVVEPMEHFFERPWALIRGEGRTPQVDLEEKPGEIVVTAKLPGMSRDDVKIEVTENTLTLRGSTARAQEQRRHGTFQRRESSQTFIRRFSLPAAVKTAEVTASFKGGLLEIRLPRVAEIQVRSVDIE